MENKIRDRAAQSRSTLCQEKSAAIVAGLCELWAAPRRARWNCCRVRFQGLARARTFLGASTMHGPLGSGSGGYIPSLLWGAGAALGRVIERTTPGDDWDRALPNVGAWRPCRTVLLYNGSVRKTRSTVRNHSAALVKSDEAANVLARSIPSTNIDMGPFLLTVRSIERRAIPKSQSRSCR